MNSSRFLTVSLAFLTFLLSLIPTTFSANTPPSNSTQQLNGIKQSSGALQINLTPGQTQRVKLNSIANRINITIPNVVDPFSPDPLTLSIRALAPGVTNLQIFYLNNTQESITVVVSPVDRTSLETVEDFLKNKLSMYGLKVNLPPVDNGQVQKIEVSGETLKYNEACITDIIQTFADLVDNKVAYMTPKPCPPPASATAAQGGKAVATALPPQPPAKPLVQIDVAILDIDLLKSKDFGIDWFSSNSSIVFNPGGAVSTTVLTGLSPFNVNPYTAATNLNFNYMEMQLRALIEENCAKILATPKLTVRSGEKASFMSGGEVPIVSTTANTSSVTYRKFGTQLDITPVVQPKSMVAVDVKASFSEIDPALEVAGNPGFAKKEAATSLTIESGLTFALAGFLERDRTETVTRLPFFGQLPIIGQAFRKNINIMEEKETLVLITPHILGEQKGCYQEPTIGSQYVRAETDYMLEDDIFGLNKMCNKMEKRRLSEDCAGDPIYVDPRDPCSYCDADGFFYDW